MLAMEAITNTNFKNSKLLLLYLEVYTMVDFLPFFLVLSPLIHTFSVFQKLLFVFHSFFEFIFNYLQILICLMVSVNLHTKNEIITEDNEE